MGLMLKNREAIRNSPQEMGGDWAKLKAAKLDPKSGTPLHGQIRASLEKLIVSGAFPAGFIVPGEQELARHFEVSRITVKRALNDLALAGFVRRMRGRGTIVTGSPARPVISGSFNTLLSALNAVAAETEVELLSVETAPASADIADHLELARGSKVQRAIRLRRLRGTPFSYLITHVPAGIASRYSREQLATQSFLKLLEQADAKVTSADQFITAIAASSEAASALQISTGAPLLFIKRIMRSNDRAVQVVEAHYRPDQFEYRLQLTRKQDGEEEIWSDGP